MRKLFALIAFLAVFALGSAQKLTHAQALTRIQSAGILISSSKGCNDRNTLGCTSLEQIRTAAINGAVALKQASGCPITIVAGTEVGHHSGTHSHSNGYKLDYRLNSCLTSYLKNNYVYIGVRSDGAFQYKSGATVCALEGNHWDCTYQ